MRKRKEYPAAVHGEARKGRWTPEYVAWRNMKVRCHIPSASNFKRYGGRGIFVCPEWRANFAAFLAEVGRRPSPEHSLERKDNAVGYVPGNVRWATPKEQARNRRSSRMLTAFGETLTMAEWTERLGLSASIIFQRLRSGWSVEDAVSTPKCRAYEHAKARA